MGQNKKNLIVTIADDKYIDYSKQLFSSILKNSNWKGDLMLLTTKIDLKTKKLFESKGILVKKVNYPIIKEWVKTTNSKTHPQTISLKFELFDTYFKNWNKIIYLDTDIIVKTNINDLLKTKKFSAVEHNYSETIKDELIHNSKSSEENNKYLKFSKKINLSKQTLNSGVFCINTKIITSDLKSKIIKTYKKYAKISKFSEQTILSIFFYDIWEKKPFTYNLAPIFLKSKYNIKKSKIHGNIIHFMGSGKYDNPWNKKNPYYKEWKKNYDDFDTISSNRMTKKIQISNNDDLKIKLMNIKILILKKMDIIKSYIDRIYLYITK